MKIWFTSDLHFGHENILKFTSRGKSTNDYSIFSPVKFSDIKTHDEYIISVWNKQVNPNDIVYILGDVIWSTVKNPADILSRLNGSKHLIIGNHDKITIRQAKKMGFASAYYSAQIKLGGNIVNLSHYPYKWGFWDKVRIFFTHPSRLFRKRRMLSTFYPRSDGKWLIHGHTHERGRVNEGKRMIHVGWDAWGRLVSGDEIVNIINVDKSL